MLQIYNKYGQLKVVSSTSSSGVSSVSGVSPITSTGGSNPIISTLVTPNKLLGRHSASTGPMQEITLGSGLTLTGATLNVTSPVTPYALTKTNDTNVTLTLGGSPSVALLAGVSLTLGWTGTLADSRIASAATWNAKQNALNGTGFVKSTAGVISYDTTTYYPYPTGTVSQYIDGTGAFQTFPTIPTVGTWGALNYPTWTTGTPFVKMTAAGTFALDPNIYITDAPSDGTTYGRNNGNWTAIASSGGLKHSIATGTDVYTTTISGVTSYTDGDAYLIRFTNGNTTGSTLNINSLGAVPLYRNNDGPLLGGDITSGGEMLCVYNSASNIFQVIGISPNSLYAYVTNDDSITITKGMPVYAFSGTGDRMTVKRAFNTGDATSAQTVGLVLSTSIAAGQKGIIMMQGLLDGLSILPTSTFSDGDPVYLGATAGTITNVKPYAPNHLVYLGVVTTANNGSAGRMYVRVQNGYELDEIHNVQARTPSLKDTLWYDNTVSPAQWKTASIATILGYTPANDADVVHKTGNETIAGDKDFTSRVQAESGFWYTLSGVYKGQIVNISDDTFYNVNSGRTHYFGMGNGVGIANVPNNASVPNGTFSILLQTANTIASFDANKNIVSLPLATYPSLTELSYVKGVTSAIQTQFDTVNVNVITITTAVSITTDTTSGSYGQHGRHVKISNGANAINIQCVSTSNADFVASYEKLGTSNITFTAGAGITLTTLSGTAILSGVAGSKACLSRTSGVYYLQITNY